MINALTLDHVEILTRRKLRDDYAEAVRVARLEELITGEDFALVYCEAAGRRLTAVCLDLDYAKLIGTAQEAGLLETPLELDSRRFLAWRKGWVPDWVDGSDPGPWVPASAIN